MPMSLPDRSLKTITNRIVGWLHRKLLTSDKKGFIVGVSGGVDSAVVALLARQAGLVLTMILPCESSPQSIRLAENFVKKFSLPYRKIDLTGIYQNLLKLYGEPVGNGEDSRIARANLKARLRMITLYYFANRYNYLVLGTGNKSELSIGYFTKYGDGGVDLLPIGDLYKTDVWRLARYLKVPARIIQQAPSAGLWKGQTDEKEMGLPYKILDEILSLKERKKEIPINLKKYLAKITQKMALARHKLQPARKCLL